jgi:heterodisulfide reductase subunit A
MVAKVSFNLCTGCGMCVDVCPYEAISLKDGKAEVNEVLCEGCGTCSATCLRAAIEVKNLTPLQIHEMINASLGG